MTPIGARQALDTALVLGATMRLTRLVVTDDIGEWFVKIPLSVHEASFEHRHERKPWYSRWHDLPSGLDCPFCVGFHIGWLVMASERLTRDSSVRGAWRFVMGALTLNEVAAHAGARLGDTAE